MAESRVYVVTDAGADGVIAREIARTGSSTRRALDGWAMTSGVPTGGTSGGVSVYGSSPLQMADNGDGTADITQVAPGATLTDNYPQPGELTITIGGAA